VSVAPLQEAPILEVDALSRYFPVRNAFGMKIGAVRALDGVSFEVQPGETLGIVESRAAASRPSARRLPAFMR